MSKPQNIDSAKKTPPLNEVAEPEMTRQQIAARAYDRYLARGQKDGHDLDDWLDAERELRERIES